MLDGARRAGVSKVVYAASGGTLYGALEARELPVDETHGIRPSSPYGVSKKVAIDYLQAFRDLYGLEFTALALANVYGPRQDSTGEAGGRGPLRRRPRRGASTIDGDGLQTRDFVFVDDVVDAFARAVERGGGLVVNVGTGVQTSIARLYVQRWPRRLGSVLPPEHGPSRPGDVRANALDPGRAKLHLGWVPWTSLEEGVAATLAFAARRGRSRTGR